MSDMFALFYDTGGFSAPYRSLNESIAAAKLILSKHPKMFAIEIRPSDSDAVGKFKQFPKNKGSIYINRRGQIVTAKQSINIFDTIGAKNNNVPSNLLTELGETIVAKKSFNGNLVASSLIKIANLLVVSKDLIDDEEKFKDVPQDVVMDVKESLRKTLLDPVYKKFMDKISKKIVSFGPAGPNKKYYVFTFDNSNQVESAIKEAAVLGWEVDTDIKMPSGKIRLVNPDSKVAFIVVLSGKFFIVIY